MSSAIFKKSVFISFLGHITVFSIFSFTFGDRIINVKYADVAFLGQILRNSDLVNPVRKSSTFQRGGSRGVLNAVFALKGIISSSPLQAAGLSNGVNRQLTQVLEPYQKPMASLPIQEKQAIQLTRMPSPKKIKEPVIMFYPRLPQHFLLYFKDRQRVHIELMFNISSTAKTNTISIKRKISSGNLEADLLSMRYISHYLFIQQARFIPNNWQTVKIDLSAKND